MKEIKIRGRKVILSERSSKEVLDQADFYKKHPPKTDLENLFIMAAVLEASIRTTRMNLSWYKVLENIRYRKYKIKYLLKYLSQSDLMGLYQDVLLIEGNELKKKVTEQASQE